MQVSEAKRLRELEEENRRLKQMYAELSLDHKILKDIVERCMVRPGFARAATGEASRVLHKCIRPVYGARRLLAMMEIRTRLA